MGKSPPTSRRSNTNVPKVLDLWSSSRVGRLALVGLLAEPYKIKETPSASYPQRTQWNVRDSDGTVIFTMARNLTGGSKLTADAAKRLGKPWLHLSAAGYDPSEKLLGFISENNIEVPNVAGTRGSKEPAVAKFVKQVLEEPFFPSPQGLDRRTRGRLIDAVLLRC